MDFVVDTVRGAIDLPAAELKEVEASLQREAFFNCNADHDIQLFTASDVPEDLTVDTLKADCKAAGLKVKYGRGGKVAA